MPTPKPQPGTRSIERQIEIVAPIEAVWKALTDAEELVRWFPLEAGTHPDGTTWMGFGQFRMTARTEVFDSPHHLRAVPMMPPVEAASSPTRKESESAEAASAGGPPPMATDVFLETRGGKTVVRLVHSGFSTSAEWDEEFHLTGTGWRFQLLGLRLYLERHAGAPRRVVWARQVIRQSLAELSLDAAWNRLMSTKGLLAEGSLQNVRSGDRYALRTVYGDALQGMIYVLEPPQDFVATVETLNGALLRIQFDVLPLRATRDVSLWLSTYGVAGARVEELQQRWSAMLAQLFPTGQSGAHA